MNQKKAKLIRGYCNKLGLPRRIYRSMKKIYTEETMTTTEMLKFIDVVSIYYQQQEKK